MMNRRGVNQSSWSATGVFAAGLLDNGIGNTMRERISSPSKKICNAPQSFRRGKLCETLIGLQKIWASWYAAFRK